MEVRVLGPVELVANGRPCPLAPMPRRLLAALATRAGEACSADFLIDALWSDAPPASAAKLLQVYVSQLRKALPDREGIRTRGVGYGLEPSDGVTLDALRFERLFGEGRTAAAGGNPALAASLLRRAISLWRGAAFGELAYEEFARLEAERLEELRLACLEERLEAELLLGRHRELLAELQSFAAGHPLRERSQANAMFALYRCGRQTEALELFRTARSRLRDELGLEPGPGLRDLQRRVLEHDPMLAAPPPAEKPMVRLPIAPNELIGRERNLSELLELLLRDDVRLLVLAGAGGSGKTRLAVEAARRAAAGFANGVVFVPLAAVRNAGLVSAAIADAAGVQPGAGQDVLQTLAVAFGSRELLLVVDNAEHVRSAAPLFVELLAQAPRLTLLVTSRVVLHLTGEHVYPVQPLAADDAAELFRQRALAADPTAAFDEAQEDAIATICARLDGLPLAVELAAARARTLTPTELLERLERRLPLLAGGPRDLPARQQTLRAALDWSYGLLDGTERRLFRRMSVFAASSTLDAIETVCETTPDVVASLVDHNLVHRTATGAVSRFAMLETVREFAAERLHESADEDRVRRRHAEWLLNAAESWRDAQRSQQTRPGTPRVLPPEPDDTRVALEWALAKHDALAPRLAVAAGRQWHAQGRLDEGRGFIEAALALGQGDEVRAELLGLLAAVSYDSGDAEAAEKALAEALSVARKAGDEPGEGWLRALRAEVKVELGRPLLESLADCEAAALLLERAGDRARLADALVVLGRLRFWAGERPADTAALERAVALARATQNRTAELLALESLALLYINLTEPTDLAIAEQVRLLEAARGAPRAEAGILMSLAWLYQYAGRFDDARSTLARSRGMFNSFGVTVEWALGARTAAAIELLAGDPIAAERELREAHSRIEGADRATLASVTGWLAEALYAQGRYEEACRAALDARQLTPRDDREVHVRSRAVEAKVRAHRREDSEAERLLHDAAKYLLTAAPPPRGPSADLWTTTLLEPETLSPSLVGTLLLARSEVLQLLGKHEQAAQTARAAHNLYRNKHAWPLAARAQRQLEHAR